MASKPMARRCSFWASAVGAILANLVFPPPALANMGYWGPGFGLMSEPDAGSWAALAFYVAVAVAVSAAALFAIRRLAHRSRPSDGEGPDRG